MSNDIAIQSLKEKIDDLNQQAWEARVNDSPKALELSQESVKLSRNINYSKGLAEGLRSLGFAYVRLFKNDEAAPLLRESLSLFQSLNDLKGQAIVYEYLGIIERNWGNLGASLEFLLKGNDLSQQSGPLEIEITSCYQVGVTYKHLGNHENALDYLYKALSLSKKISFTLMEGYAINIIGSIYFDNSDYNHALECYQQGLIIRQQSHDKWGEAGSLDNIGFTYLKLNDLDKAIDHCKQSLEMTRATGDKKGEANSLLHLAEIYQQAGNIGQASKFSNESLEIRKTRGDKRGEAEVLLFLADLHTHQSDVEDHKVFEWLSCALEIAKEIKAQDILSKAYYNLHEYHTQHGNYKDSLVQLEAHLQIEKELHKNTINQKISNLEISHKAETISQRNKELTELNEQIEKANEELKIEASLERVRAVAMGMKEPADMINVCRMISDQLLQLGFKEIRNVQTAIIYPEKYEYLNYQYFTPYDKVSIETIDYRLHPDVLKFADQMLASADAYYTKIFEGKELEDWREYRKQTNQLPDPKLDEVASSHYYFYSIGSGALGVTTYAPLSEKEISLFKRFRNVFELAYRRFVDIEKAQAQAREARIEAGLERVRSRSMAMHNTSELQEVIHTVHKELLNLNIAIHGGSFIAINRDVDTVLRCWGSGGTADTSEEVRLPLYEHPFCTNLINRIKSAPGFFTEEYTQKEKKDFFTFLFKHEPWSKLDAKQKNETLSSPGGYTRSCYVSQHTSIFIINHFGKKFSAADNDILQRFGKVFEQTYTRFLDLQKAEAQARESQIELGLERVRARAMAMQTSDELKELITTLSAELSKLDFVLDRCFINIIDPKTMGMTWWMANPETPAEPIGLFVKYHEHIPYLAHLEAWKEKKVKWEYILEGEQKKTWDKFLFVETGLSQLPEIVINDMRSKEKVYLSSSFNNFGYLSLATLEPLTGEQFDIMLRFAKVFDLTYTRFNDLKQAEAQAREAQIEASLERVRSRSMAMHKSDELREVVAVLFAQLQHIGFDIKFCTIALIDKVNSTVEFWLSGFSQQILPESYHVPNLDHPFYQNFQNTFRQGTPYKVFELAGEEKRSYDKLWFTLTDFKNLPQPVKKPMMEMERVVLSCAFTKNGMIQIGGFEPLSDTDASIVQRFAKVFEQTHTRFLDLQKAEAQAREAQIETGLERVRSKTMAMHKSEEVTGVAVSLNEELLKLGFEGGSTIIIINKETGDTEQWTGFSEDKSIKSCHVPYFKHPGHDALLVAWKKGEKYLVYDLAGEEKRSFDEHYFTTGYKNFPESDKKWMRGMGSVTFSYAFMKYGAIHWGPDHLTEEQLRILQRFAKVFEQSYTRFLDLQKAEAQAREAQIEAALERVRAKVMAMTSSKDLDETSLVFGEQLRKLNIDWQFSYFWLIDEAKNDTTFWITWPDYKTSLTSYTLAEAEQYFNDCLISWRAGVKIHDNYVPPEGVQEWLDTFQRVADDAGGVAKEIMVFNTFTNGVYYYDAMMKYGSFGICISKPATDEEKKIQGRFAIEFERAYTRFLDLKQAEAQAREAKIETALEKVRSRSLAMHKSGELQEVVTTVFDRLKELDIQADAINLDVFNENRKDAYLWTAVPGHSYSRAFHIPYTDATIFKDIYDGMVGGKVMHSKVYSRELKDEFLNYIFEHTDFREIPQERKDRLYATDASTVSVAYAKNTAIIAQRYTNNPFSEDENEILKRFANVFEQCYIRFKDLEKAEAQAREAKIEAALERTRTQSMIMQHSKELDDTLRVFHEQVLLLGIQSAFSFLWLPDEEKERHIFWAAWAENVSIDPLLKKDPTVFKSKAINYPLDRNEPATAQCLVDWKGKEPVVSYHVPPTGVDNYFAAWQELISGVEHLKPDYFSNGLYYVEAFMKYGCFGVMIESELSEDEKKILGRFAVEFERTYTRFLDLQKAEAQAREALIEAALERVRARALAMQQPEELKDVAQVLRNEMGALGVEELETCSIYIHGDSSEKVECWYALQDPNHTEKKMVSDHFVLNLDDTWVGREMKRFYGAGEKQTSIVMQGINRKEWINYCYEHSPVFSGFYGDKIPDRTYHLYKFSHGYIGAAAPGDISGESWKLLGRAASVFSLAYSRFKDLTQARNDLIKLKEEKQRAEDALTELQTTQKQLIQAEKMASLGELTAGIAHEIQNPLNFVNNFSDVSNELLEEMKTELEKGNAAEAKAIAIDVKENLEKILHHGKRADAIVKGMLQHSRTSSGQKEPTDVNVLAEEYLRLAYHGLRAKDKFFNAKFETDLDPSINKINIVPQEIGRVILNLINNSFYAVSEKKRSVSNGYEPSVTVSTKKVNDKIEIRVKDNGNGIPQKDLDKIFQPFFTTKPTGQGTGLGLSLSYDIVTKGHDGEIKVETKEGEGSAFTISLPMK